MSITNIRKKNDYMPILKTTICSEVSTRRKHYGLETLEPVQKPILNTLYKNRRSDDLVLDLDVNMATQKL